MVPHEGKEVDGDQIQWCAEATCTDSWQLTGAKHVHLFPTQVSVTSCWNSHRGNIYIREINKHYKSRFFVFLESWLTSTSLAILFIVSTLVLLWDSGKSLEGFEYKNDINWFKKIILTQKAQLWLEYPHSSFLPAFNMMPSHTLRKWPRKSQKCQLSWYLVAEPVPKLPTSMFLGLWWKQSCFNLWWSGLLLLATKDIPNWYMWRLKVEMVGLSLFGSSTPHLQFPNHWSWCTL